MPPTRTTPDFRVGAVLGVMFPPSILLSAGAGAVAAGKWRRGVASVQATLQSSLATD